MNRKRVGLIAGLIVTLAIIGLTIYSVYFTTTTNQVYCTGQRFVNFGFGRRENSTTTFTTTNKNTEPVGFKYSTAYNITNFGGAMWEEDNCTYVR